MTRTTIGVAVATSALLLAGAFCYRLLEKRTGPGTPVAPASAGSSEPRAHPSLLYGRVTTHGGDRYLGRLRFGHDEEAAWGETLNGTKADNRWAPLVPPERLLKKSEPVTLFGVEVAERQETIELERPFMARFGDIARIERHEADVRVTLKSGAEFILDRHAAGDFDDGLHVWDDEHGLVEIGTGKLASVEWLPAPAADGDGDGDGVLLHATVRSAEEAFTGFVQWNRRQGLRSDTLDGRTQEGLLVLRFDTLRSVERRAPDGCLVTLLDGRKIALSGTREAGDGNLGIYVDDMRYGRVLVAWDDVDRVDFTPGGGGDGPAYDDFPVGGPLTGSVTDHDGRRFAGRLVFDLDESETAETLDAPARGVTYSIPFGLIASIAPSGRVTLHGGETLQLEARGDLGEENAGMLVFVDAEQRPEYLAWAELARVDLDRPDAMYPPLGE